MARDTIMHRRARDRIDWLKEGGARYDCITARQAEIIPQLLAEGATLVEVVTLEGMPTLGAIYSHAKHDPTFAAAMADARALNATTRLEEAQYELIEAAQAGDVDRMRVAQAYASETRAYVEKIAPREYGTLVKLAGADGGALQVNVVDYATQVIAEHPSTAIDADYSEAGSV